MIEIRRSEDRGQTRTDWLESHHSFSFGEYRNPARLGFRRLRVINDDVIAPGTGFGTHPHRDMEILTFMSRGSLAHRDSMGNGSVIQPGDVQRMTAGTGVRHSEINPSPAEDARLLQVWIEPEELGLEPSYEQRSFSGPWRLVASRDGRDDSITVHQDVDVYRGSLEAGDVQHHLLRSGRHAWIQVVEGSLEIDGNRLAPGDAFVATDEPGGESPIEIHSTSKSQVLLFDLA